MTERIGSNERMSRRRGAAKVMASSVTTITLAGCLQINEDHCIAKGGDAYCSSIDADRPLCSMSPDRTQETSENGCVDEMSGDLVHVEYGLPKSFDAFLQALEMAAPLCSMGDAETLRGAYDTLFDDVISLLDGRSRASRRLEKLPRAADDFERAVDDWISSCVEQATSTGTDTTDTDDTSSTTGTTESTTGVRPPCTSDEMCMDAAAPFCNLEGGECVSCDGMPKPDAACAEADAMTPLCVDGACVACTAEQTGVCDQQLLLCDPAMNACAPCTEHEQCSSGACDIFVGTCFDQSTVVEVGGGGTQPATIAEGLVALEELWPDMLGERRGVLVLFDGTYDETATVQAGSLLQTDADAVVFQAAEGDSPSWVNTDVMPGSPTLTVLGATTRAYLDGIAIRTNGGTTGGWGLRCNGARVDIRRSRIVANAGGGIQALGQCDLYIENSFVGGDVNDRDSLSIVGADVSARVVYSTLGAGFSSAAALRCDVGEGVEVRNSLLVARTDAPEIDCDGAQVTSSASEAGNLGNMLPSWFADYAAGDFHLGIPAPTEIQIAAWQPGDPSVDIDGDPRVTNGQPDHAGADVP